jgi:hypothetical protein
MNVLSTRLCRRAAIAAALLTGLSWPGVAHAQYGAPDLSGGAIGEKYHVEFAGTLWNPNITGLVSSEQFGQVGTEIDFMSDLGYVKTRFRDMRIVLRPSKKSKFRIQYTPLLFESETTFRRNIVFNGINFPVSVPIESSFAWKTWRFGYQYDFVSRSRGSVGMLLEVRQTQAEARIKTNSPIFSPAIDEYSMIKAPLPAFGVVGRAYPIQPLAINFELSGFRLPDVDPQYQADYFDWDIHGTYNFTNNFGVQMGWRKITTYLAVERDLGDVKFQGTWFGAVARY